MGLQSLPGEPAPRRNACRCSAVCCVHHSHLPHPRHLQGHDTGGLNTAEPTQALSLLDSVKQVQHKLRGLCEAQCPTDETHHVMLLWAWGGHTGPPPLALPHPYLTLSLTSSACTWCSLCGLCALCLSCHSCACHSAGEAFRFCRWPISGPS